jgi:hypothetical protein
VRQGFKLLAFGSDENSGGTRPPVAELNKMEEITAEAFAYTAAQVRPLFPDSFSFVMQIVHNLLGIEKWGQPHDLFNVDEFYYNVHEMVKDNSDPFVKRLFKQWNEYVSLLLDLSNLPQKVLQWPTSRSEEEETSHSIPT